MTSQRKALALILGGGTVFLWQFAWLNYITSAIYGTIFPILPGFSFFACAVLLTLLLSGPGWRAIPYVISTTAGFALLELLLLHSFHGITAPFFRFSWVADLFLQPRDGAGWMTFVFFLLLPVLFWGGGISIVRKRNRAAVHYSRLDIGIAFFMLLFILKFILRLKGDLIIPDQLSVKLFVSFLVFAVAGIALSGNRGSSRGEFTSHRKGAGIMFAFMTAIVGGVILFYTLFLPFLTTAAEAGYSVFSKVAKPVGGVIVRVFRFLLTGPRVNSCQAVSGSGTAGSGGGIPQAAAEDPTVFGRIMQFLLTGLGLIIIAAFIAALVWLIIRRIKRRKRGNSGTGPAISFARIAAAIRNLINRFIELFTGKNSDDPGRMNKTAIHIFTGLLRWGTRRGLPRQPSETAGEYGQRLAERFTYAAGDIALITRMFQEQVYGGERSLADFHDIDGSAAFRNIRHPRHLLSRISIRFTGDSGRNARQAAS